MNDRERRAYLLELIDRLNQKQIWCDPEELQMAVYFLQEVLHVPTGFPFVMYKFAPRSYDLATDIAELRAKYFWEWYLLPDFGGAILWPTDLGTIFRGHFAKELPKWHEAFTFACRILDKKSMSELERISTALFLRHRSKEPLSEEATVQRMLELHPDVRRDEAMAAGKELDRIVAEAKCLKMDTTAA